MASNALTATFAATLLSNSRASSSPLPLGLGPHSVLSPKPSPKASSSKPLALVGKAQQGGSPKRLDSPMSEQFRKNVALPGTSFYDNYSTPSIPLLSYIAPTPRNTREDGRDINTSTMWFIMPGLGPENIEVEVVDDVLIIKGAGGVDGFGNKIASPYDSRVQLPPNSWKEEISAMYKNGVLYITVPKIVKSDHSIIHIPVTSAY